MQVINPINQKILNLQRYIKQKVRKMSDFKEFVVEQLKDEEFQKEYMNESLAQYIQDGDFNAFFRSLEAVIKSRDSISGFCQKAGIDRALLYDIFSGNRVPRVDTLAKILKTLGYNLKVA